MATEKKVAGNKPEADETELEGAWSLPVRQQPETLRLGGAGPSCTVNDIEKSRAWYRDVLGCLEKDRWERDGKLVGLEMRAGAVAFYIEQDDWKKGRDRRKGEAFSIYCTTAQDIDELAALIKARGGTLADGPPSRPGGARDFAIVDPDGFKIRIASST